MYLKKLIFVLSLLALPFGLVQAQTTNFTYQGYLELNGAPVNSVCDFTFSLYDTATSGALIGTPQNIADVTVTEGVFSVQLDFGAGAFNGVNRWLEIAVDCGEGVTPLAPRQAITPAAYATFASTAGSVDWSNISNLPAGFADGIDHDTTYTAGTGINITSGVISVPTNTFWETNGNNSIVDGTHFIGTVDSIALDFRVGNQRILRLEPNNNIIGGYTGNEVTNGAGGATISGGGENGSINFVTRNFGTVSGGASNSVTGTYGTVGGGWQNQAGDSGGTNETAATVGGGQNNRATGSYGTVSGGENNLSSFYYATVGGGHSNTAGGLSGTVSGGSRNVVNGDQGTVGGGHYNFVRGGYGTIGGGGGPSDTEGNQVTDFWGTVGGGYNNQAGDDDLGNIGSSLYTTVAGGANNKASGDRSIVGGGENNQVTAQFGTIGGGGATTEANGNLVTDNWGTVGGGYNNQAGDADTTISDSEYATVAGGANNTANNQYSTVSGGSFNSATGSYSTIGGGQTNTAAGLNSTISGGNDNDANGQYSTVSGGYNNTASNNYDTVSGGESNSANGDRATIGGGFLNQITGSESTIGGGAANTITGLYTTIGGGRDNSVSGNSGTIGGGNNNQITTQFGTIGGGGATTDANGNLVTGDWGTVGGGFNNQAGDDVEAAVNHPYATVAGGADNKASGQYSTIPGGSGNFAAGNYSFAAGQNAYIDPSHHGAFVWADNSETYFLSASGNEFAVRATGGVRLVTGIDGTGAAAAGMSINAGGSGWNVISDKAAKTNFEAVDTRAVLEQVAAMPITTWNYRTQDEAIRHIGPMAQDFAALGVGENDTTINTIDADGVALAAIQGLNLKLQDEITLKNAEISGLRQQITIMMVVMVAGFGVLFIQRKKSA